MRWSKADWFGGLAIVLFAVACFIEEPYLVAFWGVYLICDAIREGQA